MTEQNLLKQRFTIHNFILPIDKNRTPKPLSFHKKHKPSHSNYQSEKRVICAQSNPNHMRERWSEELERVDPAPDKMRSLPEIQVKSKTLDATPAFFSEERAHSFSYRKLNVNAYHKIEHSINQKYCRKMESLASLKLRPDKLFSINNLKGDLPLARQPERERQERVQRCAVEKHHIDRLKDQFQIPLELQTQRYQQQEFDDHQLSLQLKNIIRFEFHTQMSFAKPIKKQPQEETAIDAWDIERSHVRPAAHLYS